MIQFLTSFILFMLISVQAHATSFSQVPFENRALATDVIVLGKIVKIHADWADDSAGDNRIYTFYDLDVIDVIKGNLEKNELVFRQMGGTVGSSELHYPGTAEFYQGEEVLVFLAQAEQGVYELKSLQMGKYKILEESGKRIIVGAGVSNLDFYQLNVHHKEAWTLENLKEVVDRKKDLPKETVELIEERRGSLEAEDGQEKPILEADHQQSPWARFFRNDLAVAIVLVTVMLFMIRRIKGRKP